MTEGDKPTETVSFAILGRRVTLPLAALGFFGVVLTALGALGGSWIALLTKDHELKIKLVEIGISILRAPPNEHLAPARRWATKIIGKNAGLEFSKGEEDALVENALPYDDGYYDTTYTPGFDYSSAPDNKKGQYKTSSTEATQPPKN